mgnify:CR=1 FL=1
MMYARNTKVDGNLNMTNGGGFLEVGNVQVGKDMNLKTVAKSENPQGYKHFVHVIGKNKVGGNLTINSENNIHIGNYKFEEGQLLDGKMEASTPKWMLLNRSLFNCPYKKCLSCGSDRGGIFSAFIQSLLFRLQILHYRPSRCLFR